MTPDEARDLLDGTTPGPWHVNPKHSGDGLSPDEVARAQADAALIAAAPTLAAMIAGMRTEYRTEEWQGHSPGWVPTSPWTAEKPVGGPGPNTRLVRRYVTEPEEA